MLSLNWHDYGGIFVIPQWVYSASTAVSLWTFSLPRFGIIVIERFLLTPSSTAFVVGKIAYWLNWKPLSAVFFCLSIMQELSLYASIFWEWG